MSLTVYNTLSRKRESFVPIEPQKVGIYACGVTVYDVCHIGHAMQAIIYDVIRNFFKYSGYEVTYVRNYTDVDDKIINRANDLGISALEHSENMIKASEEDLALLGVQPADIEPKVSDHIPEIIEIIERLIERDHAYASEGDVYYKVGSFSEYGMLSNRSPDDMRAGARVAVNTKKQDPLDFALWKAAKDGEVFWDSPWGKGRPGWHIECSALSMKYLGKNFDIHGGGKDLIFPHHENEIAQSMASCSCNFASYWIHNGLITVDGRKMSKSFNNFLSIRDAVAKYFPETVRYTILCHHYSSNIDFSEKAFYDAYSRLTYFYNTLQQIENLAAAHPEYPKTIPDQIQVPDIDAAFLEAMNDDFNTGAAIREIGAVFKFLNDLITAKKPKLKQKLHTLVTVAESLKPALAVLGLLQTEPTQALNEIQSYLIRQKKVDVSKVEGLLEDRKTARTEKDWGRADEIRDELIEMGICVMDTPQGTTWQVLP